MSLRLQSCTALAAIAASLALGSTARAGHLNAVLTADLDGREVAADAKSRAIVGDPNGRGEIYVFGIDGDPLTLCYVLLVAKIGELEETPGNGRAAHIHEAGRGANGPVVANLAWPQDGQAADCLTEGETGKFPGNEAGIVQRILTHPHDFYVNVHNAAYPAGALRGQLESTLDHAD